MNIREISEFLHFHISYVTFTKENTVKGTEQMSTDCREKK